MVRLVVAFLVSAAVTVPAWGALRHIFDQPLFRRPNHRGVLVPVGAGLVLVVVLIALEATLGLAEAIGDPAADRNARLLSLAVVAAFGLLGLVDDLAAADDHRGFGGHLAAMRTGRVSTGGLKLVGGGLVGLVAGAALTPDAPLRILLGGAVIALAANLANLFDRAPGRTIKLSVLVGIAVVLSAGVAERPELTGMALVVGAAVGLGVFDLRERLMLGDAGANPLGAALGLGVVLTAGALAQTVVLVALIGLNVSSERVSFSSVIDRVPPLRAIDRLGRRRIAG